MAPSHPSAPSDGESPANPSQQTAHPRTHYAFRGPGTGAPTERNPMSSTDPYGTPQQPQAPYGRAPAGTQPYPGAPGLYPGAPAPYPGGPALGGYGVSNKS